MKWGRYLPSKQFSVIGISLLLSIGLVYAADAATHPTQKATVAVDTQTSSSADADWQASLDTVQSQSGVTPPSTPVQTKVDGLLQAAKSSNITDTISRSLLVNLTSAEAQGMGSDIPTQDSLVNQALSQIPSTPSSATTYTSSDLTVVNDSTSAMHDYGNAVMSIFLNDSDQEYAKTLVIIDAVTTSNDATKLPLLKPIQEKYKTIATALAGVPVPKTLVPFDLELINDYEKIYATYDGLGVLVSDPVEGITSVQQYNSLTQDAGQMFINIAQSLDKNDILFNKDEPGATWDSLLQAQTSTN